MFDRAKVIRLVPDEPGKGGIKSVWHSRLSRALLDTRFAQNVYVWFARWRKDRQAVASAWAAGDDATYTPERTSVIYPYTAYSRLIPTALPVVNVLAQHVDSGNNSTLMGYAAGTPALGAVSWGTETPSDAVFCTVGNRCFYCDGAREGQILPTPTGTPYPIGTLEPTNAPAYTISIPTASLSGCSATYEKSFLNFATVSSTMANWAPGTPLTINGVAGYKTTTAGTTTFNNIGTLIAHAGTSSVEVTTVLPTDGYYFGLTINYNGESHVIIAQSNPTGGVTTQFTISGTSASGFSGVYTVTGTSVQITPGYGGVTAINVGATTYGTGELTWASNGPTYAYAWYDHVTGHISNISPTLAVTEMEQAGIRVRLTSSFFSLPHTADRTRFKYIIIFRTRLVAGGSTLFVLGKLPDGGADSGFLGLKVADFPIGSGYWQDSYNDSYLLQNGALRAPQITNSKPQRDMALPYNISFTNGSATITGMGFSYLWKDTGMTGASVVITYGGSTFTSTVSAVASHQAMTLANVVTLGTGGATYAGTMIVSMATPATIAHLAYWDGRVWMTTADQGAALHFSADRVQVLFGVPEECYPSTNVMRVTASDGRITGLRVIGALLVVTTERWAYYIAGNNESNYRLIRFATSMNGVGDYQMDELPGETQGESSALVFLGRDRRIYIYQPGGEAEVISTDIQNICDAALDTRAKYLKSRVHVISAWGRRMLAVTLNAADSYFFDFKQRVWTQNKPYGSFGAPAADAYAVPESYCTVYGGSVPVDELFGSNGAVRSWLRDDTLLAGTTGYIETHPMDFGAKSLKQLNWIRLHVSDPTVTSSWQIDVWVNEVLKVTMTAAAYSDALLSERNASIPGSWPVGDLYTPVDCPEAVDLIAFPTNATVRDYTGTTSVTGGPLVGYRFRIRITFPTSTDDVDLYAADVCYTELSEPGAPVL